jgi:UDP-glucose:(heptosyl)LPS alpha-1,3-glucosyltransferase
VLAEKLRVVEKTIFLGEVRNIQSILTIADVAVLPTFYDPASRFILEALAAGRPVITTRFNGAADLFIDNRHGKIIDRPENVPALAAAISYFTNEANIKSASEAIIADNLRDKISVARAAEQLVSVYDSIIDKRKRQI